MGSRTSPYLQSKLVLLGCEHVYEAAAKIAGSLLCIDVNESQVYRTCQAASEALNDQQADAPSPQLATLLEGQQQPVYGMVDGSMLLTDEGWKETKVGRVFTAEQSACGKPKWEMGKSEYVARMGHFEAFTTKFEQLLDPESPADKVFITDGAVWIEQWLTKTYPEATHILDYYHVTEKLAEASKTAAQPQVWLEEQCQALLKGKSRKVEKAVAALPLLEKKPKTRLITYLENNRERMRYDVFRKRKLMISSSPVEAAHRTLLQVRMKRSGQRWSQNGANNLIKLRSALLSQKFNLVIDLFRN